MLWIKCPPPVACTRTQCQVFLDTSQHSLLPKCERNLHLRTTHDCLSGALQEVVTHLLSPPPLHSSTICYGCFKTIWPGCANRWLFWERDGKTVCYSRRPSEKKGSLRDRARRGSGGSSCVCVCGCVFTANYTSDQVRCWGHVSL